MSKISTIRIINLNYNNNTRKIDDEIFHLDGENTLFALENGGGKSVLVQVISAVFIKSRKLRNTKDRSFSEYFTSSTPTYIVVEWKLDSGNLNVMTGMMVRKKIVADDDSNDDLEIVNFISEYSKKYQYDIFNFPFIEIDDNKRKKIMSFSNSKTRFEKLKKDKNVNFNYYDMNYQPQSYSYFEKLKEYDINFKEWESIINRINRKESGLSELFNNSKNISGLVENWFLKIVEEKLDKDDSKVKKICEIVLKYIKQYHENKSKFDLKESIREFYIYADIIKDNAKLYQICLDNSNEYENKIAYLSKLLCDKLENLLLDKKSVEINVSQIENEIIDINYGQTSFEGYKHIDNIEILEKNLSSNQLTLSSYSDEKKAINKKIAIFECAKIYTEYQDFSKEVQEIENELEILKESNKDFGAERNNLGFTLRTHYLSEKERIENILGEIEQNILTRNTTLKNSISEMKESRKKLSSFNIELGALTHKIESYTIFEDKFNKNFNENLLRNIIGEYDSNFLFKLNKELNDYYINLSKELILSKENLLNLNEDLRKHDRDEKDKFKQKIEVTHNLDESKKRIIEFEDELLKLKSIVKYIDYKIEKTINKTEIISEFENKITSLKNDHLKIKLSLHSEEDKLRKLQLRRILEIPNELENELLKRDIAIVYGMEWLQKNSFSEERNIKLVEDNPFLPYSLIMNSKDINSLKKDPIKLFLDEAVIIICKDDIESKVVKENSSFIKNGKTNFLLSFNGDLINEEKLNLIIQNKKDTIDLHTKQLKEKNIEIKFYEEKKNKVEYSFWDDDKFEIEKANRNLFEKQLSDIEEELIEERKNISNLQLTIKNLNDTLRTKESDEEFTKRKLTELIDLTQKYNEYIINKDKKSALDDEIDVIHQTISNGEKIEKELNELIKSDENRRLNYTSIEKETQKKLNYFQNYKEGLLIKKDIEDIEARFQSITTTISESEKSLEKRLINANSRFKAKEKDLIEKSSEYNLEEALYRNESIDNFKEKQLKIDLAAVELNIKNINKEIVKLDKEKALLDQKVKGLLNDVKIKYNMETFKNREDIVEINFEEKIANLDYSKLNLVTMLEKLNKDIQIIENNIGSLSEYSDFKCSNSIELDVDYVNLDKFRGELIRDYKISLIKCSDAKNALAKEIEKVKQKDDIKSVDFFRRPMQGIEDLINSPSSIIESLDMCISSYKNIMDKLETDIELISKERDNVIQLIFEYVNNVHENIGKIDRNSTIKLRNQSIKMLKILLPKWEENKDQYWQNISTIIDKITNSGLERLSKNENIENLISSEINTKNLYNETVSIGNIDIKLYKVEKDQEYQISWDTVAKNSGGEGFLSAFVILSCLLSYMRQDERDIFSEKLNSKVLIMDNPFAQTYSAHLLKPLLELAKKSNTQLICLTGLGGDSIYNRFDNIYVLNLISSNFKNGLTYLKGDQRKGQVELLTSSNFKISEDKKDDDIEDDVEDDTDEELLF